MKLQEKIEQVEKIREKLQKSKASFIVDYQRLKVAELTELRKKLREAEASFRVVKNTLALRSMKGTEEGLSKFFSGPTGIIFAEKDPIASARVIKEFLPDHPYLTIKGGVLDKQLLAEDRVKDLGSLPEQEVLLGQLLTVIQLPLRRLLSALNAPLRNLIFLLGVIKEKKGGLSMPKISKEKGKVNKKEQVIKTIEEMNVLELSELVKGLEDRFGVQATPPQVISQGPVSSKKEEEEKTEFDVILSEVGSKKIQVIKEVRKLTTLGLKEAKDLVEAVPKPIKEGINKEEALKVKEILEAVGAKVELK